MNTNGNDLAFPAFDKYNSVSETGLTKREYFAAMAMQGLLCCNKQVEYGDHGNTRDMTFDEVSKHALLYADFLINELNYKP